MKRKITLKAGGKVVITLTIVMLDFIIYSFLCAHGSSVSQKTIASIFIYLGWIWMCMGQFCVLHAVWEA
jgi:hypothetical protein